MFDTHCHLQVDTFDPDRDDMFSRSQAAGVDLFLVPNIDLSTYDATLSISQRPNVFCALGIHPHHAAEWGNAISDRIRLAVAEHPKVVAIGEIGLDYYYDFAPRDVQIRAFREQIALAQELGLPVIIHTRDSIPETLDIIADCYSGLDSPYAFGQFHCFSGTVGQMEGAIGNGFCVSFTGNITFKNSALGDVVRETPLERILIETDSPYLAPVPHRGKRNTPELLPLVAGKIAEIKQIDVKTVMTKTTENAKRLFSRVSALALILLSCFLLSNASAQPGSRPPDSVMTKERRDAEEIIRRQREELARAAEERRQDSIRASQQDAAERRLQVEEQTRKDSIKAAERIAELERERIRMATPVAWKTLGITFGAGIGNQTLNQAKSEITPTSVFATAFGISSQITGGIDAELTYNSFTVEDDLGHILFFSYDHDSNAVQSLDTNNLPKGIYRRPQHEAITTSYISFDVRFVITPRSPIKFYTGLGYTAVTIKNKQDYFRIIDTIGTRDGGLHSTESSITRGGIKALIGARYDFELGSQFIITPYVQIGAAFLFSGDPQGKNFVYRVEEDPIVITHTTVGLTFNYSFGLTGERR
jgi:TatD DNase family protein